MALINKIRERSGLAIGLVAIAMGFFIVGTDILGPNSAILGQNKTDVGEIAGETIQRERYQDQIEEIKYNYTVNFGRNPSDNELYSIRQQAWEYLIVKVAFQEQYEKLGLEVTDDEHWDMIQGDNVSFQLKQAFADPTTGEFQRDRVISYLQQVNNLPPQQQAAWYMFEKDLDPSRLRIKYDNLLVKTTYVTEEEAKRQYQEQTSVAEVRYLYIPYYSVTDSLVELKESELRSYLKEHQSEYMVEESRDFSYVSVPIVPSPDDTAFFQSEMDQLKADFITAVDDSLYARNNSDGVDFYARLTVDALPNILQLNYSNLSKNDVRGPYFEEGKFVLYKVSDITEDTSAAVRASHILIKWSDESAAAKAVARNKAQGILNQLRRGADFEQLARENSQDGSAQSGGDLGWFGKGKMVKPFEDAVFGTARKGLINRLVESQFGYHIIKVTEPRNNKLFHIASVEREITPSETTRNRAFRRADLLAATSTNYNEFIENAERDSLPVYNAEKIGKNDRRFNDVGNARGVIREIYNNMEPGEVSEVLEVDDQYIIACLTNITEKGPAELEAVKAQIEPKVKNEKKAEIIVERLSAMSGSLDDIKSEYGSDAAVYSSSDLKFSASSLPSVGFAPLAVGTAFALEGGAISKPVLEENGVVMIEMVNMTKAPEIADYATYKTQLQQRRSGRASYNAGEAIKEYADIKDRRYRFF
jgi:peptidyl-prolyl cis-trans isomerase D